MPRRSDSFFATTLDGSLVVQAFSSTGLASFEQVLAREVQHVLHNPELGLFWYSDATRLWVIDIQNPEVNAWQPVLIASGLPLGDRLRVERKGTHYTGPGRISDETMELVLHWDSSPWIEGGEGGGRLANLDGEAWLARERARPARAVVATDFTRTEDRVTLPADWAGCQPPGACGAALPFGPRGWELVVTNEDASGDFLAHECLLHDPASGTFATPPGAPRWAGPMGMAPGPCGPYRFNQQGDVFLVADTVCRLGSACVTLEGRGRGWIEPGAVVGDE
jgi:hypothetical protein